MTTVRKALPWTVMALTIGYFVWRMFPSSIPGPMDISAFSRLPVSADGRVQPLDSMASNTLLTIAKKTNYRTVWLRPQQVSDYQGLAKAIVEGGAATTASPARHIWQLMDDRERAAFRSAASAKSDDEVSPQTQHEILETINRLIDDESRYQMQQIPVRPGVAPAPAQPFVRFYDEASWKGIEISDEDKAALAGFLAAHKGRTGGEDPARATTRPEEIEVNRRLFSLAFSDSVSAEKGTFDPAIVWFTDVVVDRPKASAHRVFRIENDRVLEKLELKARPGSFRYAADEFAPKIELIFDEARTLRGKDTKMYDAYEKAVVDLAGDVNTYMALSLRARPYWVAPRHAGEDWKTFQEVSEEMQAGGADHENARAIVGVLQNYAQGDVEAFNKSVAAYQKQITALLPADVARSGFEMTFNRIDVFNYAIYFFIYAFLFVIVSWLFWHNPDWSRMLRQSALAILIVVTIAYTFGLFARMYLMQRPLVFVTNLYGSAVFIGWGGLIFCLILERFTRLGIALASASVIGATTAVIALHLREIEGDTLAMLQAVLDTNFWLASHVTTVTMGYLATYLAGVLAIIYIFGGIFTNALSKDGSALEARLVAGVKSAGIVGAVVSAAATRGANSETPRKSDTIDKVLIRMIYGVLCFATLFSFVGTVLGGLWADQSWGRFWGWDVKENGALMIVLWNALILHARWGGMVKARGIATLAVFGNIVTTWSWFGTNQLGAGLHSYGRMDSTVFWIMIFVSTQIVIMAVSLVPVKWWRSFAGPGDENRGRWIGAATGLTLVGLGLPRERRTPPTCPRPSHRLLCNPSAPHRAGRV